MRHLRWWAFSLPWLDRRGSTMTYYHFSQKKRYHLSKFWKEVTIRTHIATNLIREKSTTRYDYVRKSGLLTYRPRQPILLKSSSKETGLGKLRSIYSSMSLLKGLKSTLAFAIETNSSVAVNARTNVELTLTLVFTQINWIWYRRWTRSWSKLMEGFS